MKKVSKHVGMIVLLAVIGFSFAACGNPTGRPDDGPVRPDPIESTNVGTLVGIPAGSFIMGQTGISVSVPTHKVTLSSAFYMSEYEITQAQYQAVMGTNPSYFQGNDHQPATGENQGKRPVEMISWFDAIVFCNTLSLAEELEPVYRVQINENWTTNPVEMGTHVIWVDPEWENVEMIPNADGYRLPTEAEWEYACRAGTTTLYNTGNMITANDVWYKGNSGDMTHEVGTKPANGWGLYDMHGNVNEWCWDWCENYPSSAAQTDPLGPDEPYSEPHSRVFRVGCWNDDFDNLYSANREDGTPSMRFNFQGFRLVRSQA